MFEKSIVRKIAGVIAYCPAVSALPVNTVFAAGSQINFALTDIPGHWFDTGSPIAGNRSIAIAAPGVQVNFSGNSNTVHTRTSLIYPTGAAGMPFNTEPKKGGDSLTLTTPGLYVFTCSIHPYMFGAVIVDDPATAAKTTTGKELYVWINNGIFAAAPQIESLRGVEAAVKTADANRFANSSFHKRINITNSSGRE